MVKVQRIVAAYIDFMLICLISSLLTYFISFNEEQLSVFSAMVYFISFFLMYIFRDCVFKNASVGKKIMKLKVISDTTQEAMWKTALKRNALLFLLSPIEVLLVIIYNERIGDKIAHTTVIQVSSIVQ